MLGVSEVIAIILILMITIAIAGLAYTFMSATMSSTTSAASSSISTTTSGMLTSFVIEGVNVNRLYVRNTGQTTLTGLSVYSGEVPIRFNSSLSTIAPGQVVTITINDYVKMSDIIKISSSQGFSASVKAPDQCDGAVICWRLDEGYGLAAQDSSGNGYSGNLTNGPVWTTGRFGNAVQFDGVNDYIDMGDINRIETGSSTVMLWIKPFSLNTSGYNEVIRKESAGGFHMTCSSCGSGGTWSFGYKNSTGLDSSVSIPASATPINQWTHIAMTLDGNTINAYVNGNFQSSRTLIGSRGASGEKLFVGAYGTAYPRYFNGTIDEVAIWDRALSSQEIAALYNKAVY